MARVAQCTITLPLFEGPLDLLLYLVEKHELDIYEINVASVADQYLRHLRSLEQLDLEVASEFYLMAVRLLSIKARALLPQRHAPAGEPAADEPEDPRAQLIRELVAYRRCQQRAASLDSLATGQSRLYAPPLRLAEATAAMPHMWTQHAAAPPLPALQEAYQLALARARGRGPRVITRDAFTMRQRMAELLRLLRQQGRLAWQAISAGPEGRREFVVTFLSLLELMRRRRIQVRQPGPFADLTVTLAGGHGNRRAAQP